MTKAATRHRSGGLTRIVLELLKRSYAVAVILLVAYLSYGALRYLVVTLIYPAEAPAQITGIPTRLTEDVLRTRRTDWLGVQVAESARTPIAHYHQIDGWVQPDPLNNCTQSGCHNPLPHGRSKEVRAFLNMHATSIHCGVCHLQSPTTPLPLTWYDLQTGRRTGTPALLVLYEWLTSSAAQDADRAPTAADQRWLVDHLRQAAREADGEPMLLALADQVAAPRHTSKLYQDAVAAVRDEVPRHFRGEYGAKLALLDARANAPLLAHPDTAGPVREFLSRGAQLSADERATLLARIHPLRRPATLNCTHCHTTATSLIDLAHVGYPPARIEALHAGWIFRAIEDIMAGRPLFLPGFVTPAPSDTPAPDTPPGNSQN
ncbi:MAG: hypothetical protein IPM18_16840 [Phycisphaerales bacterium]|nr:hypothetical protein [Phycisphaerales bacterium]